MEVGFEVLHILIGTSHMQCLRPLPVACAGCFYSVCLHATLSCHDDIGLNKLLKMEATPIKCFSFVRVGVVMVSLLNHRTVTKTKTTQLCLKLCVLVNVL